MKLNFDDQMFKLVKGIEAILLLGGFVLLVITVLSLFLTPTGSDNGGVEYSVEKDNVDQAVGDMVMEY